jgi:hypothetical protein
VSELIRALLKVGIPQDEAMTIEHNLAAAEGKLPPQQVAMFSRFAGIMMMDEHGNAPHDQDEAETGR